MNVFMTISLRSLLCLCAALCLCCGVVSAQQPTQQRFLRFLGQRSVTTGTLMPTVEPFRAGVPTTASLVFAIMDSEGRILKDDSTEAFLRLPDSLSFDRIKQPALVQTDSVMRSWFDGAMYGRYKQVSGFVKVQAKSGLLEFKGIRIAGKANNNMLLHCTAANIQSTSLSVSLIGGYGWRDLFVKLKNGKQAVPGRVYTDSYTDTEQGAVQSITVGRTVQFNNSDSADYNHIAVQILDPWDNPISFSTTVTISLAGGTPPVDQQRTPTLGSRVLTNAEGIAVFNDFQVLGETSSNVTLVAFTWKSLSCYSWLAIPPLYGNEGLCDPTNTSATVTLVPSRAVAIMPPLVSAANPWYGNNQTLPRFTIGKSNADDPRTWFYLQAVDQFGNRVDNGPNAYNGGVATIRIATPEEGLPRSTTSNFQFSASNDPYVRVNSQRFAATGTSAVAVNGLYTFNNFTPLGPASSRTTDTVVLTFEDPALKGVNSPFPLVPWLYRPIPPITTATTTFVRTTKVRLHEEASRHYATPNPTSDLLHITLTLPESAPVLIRMEDMLGRTMLRYEEQSALQGAFATTLDVSRLAQGAYTLHVQSGRERWTRRVVILR
jgi:hypothetical protein